MCILIAMPIRDFEVPGARSPREQDNTPIRHKPDRFNFNEGVRRSKILKGERGIGRRGRHLKIGGFSLSIIIACSVGSAAPLFLRFGAFTRSSAAPVFPRDCPQMQPGCPPAAPLGCPRFS